MSSLLVRVGAVSAALAGVLIIGQEAWGLAVGGITEGRAESAVHTGQLLLLVFGIVACTWPSSGQVGRSVRWPRWWRC